MGGSDSKIIDDKDTAAPKTETAAPAKPVEAPKK
jgi:hypothetical protein